MSNQIELNALFDKYQEAKEQADRAYDIMQSALKAKQDARKDMNQKYDWMEKNSGHYYTIWSRFRRFRNNNNARIETLHHIAKFADKARRDAIEIEVQELLKEIKDAHAEAKRRAPKTNKNAYYQSAYVFERTRNYYETTKGKYEYLQSICNQRKSDYEKARAKSESEDNQDQPAP